MACQGLAHGCIAVHREDLRDSVSEESQWSSRGATWVAQEEEEEQQHHRTSKVVVVDRGWHPTVAKGTPAAKKRTESESESESESKSESESGLSYQYHICLPSGSISDSSSRTRLPWVTNTLAMPSGRNTAQLGAEYTRYNRWQSDATGQQSRRRGCSHHYCQAIINLCTLQKGTLRSPT